MDMFQCTNGPRTLIVDRCQQSQEQNAPRTDMGQDQKLVQVVRCRRGPVTLGGVMTYDLSGAVA